MIAPFAAAIVLLQEHEGASHGFLGVPNIVWQVLNLGLFLALLVWLLKKPLASFFGGRKEQVATALTKADEDRRRAEALSKELADRLSRIESELAAFKEHARVEAENERKELLAQAEEDAKKLLARTAGEVEARVRSAKAELTTYAGDLALDLARDVVKSQVTADDQARLVHEGVGELGASARKG